ncbi:hypothetical protein Q4012_17070 [Acinetobacter nosocomialis]|uniref:hypothetical protein n=1 Tax=Acinetobacter nosocomialis TaxID=106654 RepID=UPI00254E902C|nr:hypothetical protein [Acinetobacter nosocomialis]MEC6036266.1 hypothetical protein [Acinetobacter nosocomialis]
MDSNFSTIKFLVQKGVIDLGEFQDFMKDQEFTFRKALNPEVTQKFSQQISEAFQYAALNVVDED